LTPVPTAHDPDAIGDSVTIASICGNSVHILAMTLTRSQMWRLRLPVGRCGQAPRRLGPIPSIALPRQKAHHPSLFYPRTTGALLASAAILVCLRGEYHPYLRDEKVNWPYTACEPDETSQILGTYPVSEQLRYVRWYDHQHANGGRVRN